MTIRYLLSISVALLLISGPAGAVKVYGGSGIGFSNDDTHWVANIVFEESDKAAVLTKNDLLKGAEISLQTGDVLTPTDATAPVDQLDLGTIAVPHTQSTAWCDPAANPNIPSNTDMARCYGNALDSKWFVIDLNGLQRARLASVLVTITALRYDDGIATETDSKGNVLPSDDDLVPALTVFRGRQDMGPHGDWYPNTFQQNRFWAWELRPFKKRVGSYATAYGASKADSATVAGYYRLRGGNQNYLTVAVGGDARNPSAAASHEVNFRLLISIYKLNPLTDGIFANNFDRCGCEIGQTEWHLAMDHCMSIAECKDPKWADGPPGIRCQTPAECASNGGRWACGQNGVSCK